MGRSRHGRHFLEVVLMISKARQEDSRGCLMYMILNSLQKSLTQQEIRHLPNSPVLSLQPFIHPTQHKACVPSLA